MEQNTALKFVLDRLPIGLHIPCEVLGELWGSKAKFRKKLHTDGAMGNLLAQFGIYVSTMNCRAKTKSIALLGPGKAKPLDACEQPLGAARDLVRAGSADRRPLIKGWTTPCDTERKLRVGADGARTRGLQRTPGRDFDPRAAARAAEAVAAAEGSDDDDEDEAGDDEADDMSDGGEDASPSGGDVSSRVQLTREKKAELEFEFEFEFGNSNSNSNSTSANRTNSNSHELELEKLEEKCW